MQLARRPVMRHVVALARTIRKTLWNPGNQTDRGYCAYQRFLWGAVGGRSGGTPDPTVPSCISTS